MSKATSGWQKVLNRVIEDEQTHKIGGWLCCLAIATLLWSLNWKLFLATVAGIGSMCGCYLWQNPYWQRYCKQWQKFLVGSSRQLMLAVGSGGTGAFLVYMAASIWADADNQWLATGSILQGIMSLATLIFLLWSIRGKKVASLEDKLDRLLLDLSDRDRLKRLVAIRQLTRLLVSNRLSAEHYSQSIEYYRLMLSEPQPAVIKNALLESLAILGAEQVLQKSVAVKIPLQLKNRKPILDTYL